MSAEPPRSTCREPHWRQLRGRHLTRLAGDIAADRVDRDIVDLLLALNACPHVVTTSSCSGRIAVFAAPDPADKRRGGILRSWHRRVGVSELADAVEEALVTGHPYVWVSAQPPLLALYACSHAVADSIAALLEQAGFKYAGYRFSRAGRAYYITVHGTDRIDVPIRVKNVYLAGRPSREWIAGLASLLNTYLDRAKRSLERLKSALSCTQCFCRDA